MSNKNSERTSRELHEELTGKNLVNKTHKNDLFIAKVKYGVDVVGGEIVRVNQEKKFPKAKILLLQKLLKTSQGEKTFSKPENIYTVEYIAFQTDLEDDPDLIKKFFAQENLLFFKPIPNKTKSGAPDEYEFFPDEFKKWIQANNLSADEIKGEKDVEN